MLKSRASFLKALVLRYEQNCDTLPKTMLPTRVLHFCILYMCLWWKVYEWSGVQKHVNFNKNVKSLAMTGNNLYCGCSGYSIQVNHNHKTDRQLIFNWLRAFAYQLTQKMKNNTAGDWSGETNIKHILLRHKKAAGETSVLFPWDSWWHSICGRLISWCNSWKNIFASKQSGSRIILNWIRHPTHCHQQWLDVYGNQVWNNWGLVEREVHTNCFHQNSCQDHIVGRRYGRRIAVCWFLWWQNPGQYHSINC